MDNAASHNAPPPSFDIPRGTHFDPQSARLPKRACHHEARIFCGLFVFRSRLKTPFATDRFHTRRVECPFRFSTGMNRAICPPRSTDGTRHEAIHDDTVPVTQSARCDAKSAKGRGICHPTPPLPCGFGHCGNNTALCATLAWSADSHRCHDFNLTNQPQIPVRIPLNISICYIGQFDCLRTRNNRINRIRLRIRAADAKEVGMGNPAEKRTAARIKLILYLNTLLYVNNFPAFQN